MCLIQQYCIFKGRKLKTCNNNVKRFHFYKNTSCHVIAVISILYHYFVSYRRQAHRKWRQHKKAIRLKDITLADRNRMDTVFITVFFIKIKLELSSSTTYCKTWNKYETCNCLLLIFWYWSPTPLISTCILCKKKIAILNNNIIDLLLTIYISWSFAIKDGTLQIPPG